MKNAILFDIDGTLLKASGLGRPAFGEAFAVAYGYRADFSGVSFVGATDTGVIRAMAASFGIISTPAHEERFYIELTKRLDPRLRHGPIVLCPGVVALLKRLTEAGWLIGTVTGNIRATAWGKLIYGGLGSYFTFGAYSTDHHDRDELARLACVRAKALDATARLLVGDTPKDVQAAHAANLPALAVATGWRTEEELAAAGAERTLPDFSDTDATMAVIEGLVR